MFGWFGANGGELNRLWPTTSQACDQQRTSYQPRARQSPQRTINAHPLAASAVRTTFCSSVGVKGFTR